MTQEFEDLMSSLRVGSGSYVKAHELVYVDAGVRQRLARVLAWNDIPTVFVRRESDNQLEEVEPWRIKKIEKCPQS